MIRFAVITFKNSYEGTNATYFIAYLPGVKWTTVHVQPTRVTALNVRIDSPSRISDIRNQYGTLNNWEQPLVEIGMLMKRYAVFPGAADPTDWAVQSSREIPLAEFKDSPMMTDPMYREAVYQTIYRIFAHRYVSVARLHTVAQNFIVLHSNSPGARTFEGMLSVTPGYAWRGDWYGAETPVSDYVQRRSLTKRIGALLGQCLGRFHKGMDYSGLLEDLEDVLQAREDMDLLSTSADILGAIDRNIAPLHSDVRLQRCGHFELSESACEVMDAGNPVRWCAYCAEHEAVECEDTGYLAPRHQTFYSDAHDGYYSYDIDAAENNVEFDDDTHEILDYSTNVTRILRSDPRLRSSPYGDFLLGIELELTTGVSRRTRGAAAHEIRKQLGQDYAVVKNDGSLPESGFEVVTAPRGLKEHMERLGAWNIDPGYRAWDTNQCGLHVHIHSKAFTEMTLGKFLMFFNLDTNAPFIRKLAGRHPLKDHWAARYCAQEGMSVLENPKAAVKGKSSERYRLVNSQNLTKGEAERLGLDAYRYSGKYDTIELRIFKASLKKARMLAQIEFAHAAVMFCRLASYQDLTGASFIKWLKPNSKLYPHLADWYGVRKSKAIMDAGTHVSALETVCEDKVPDDLMVPQQARRQSRRPPLDVARLNQYLTPRARREAEEQQLRTLAQAEGERLRIARERVTQLRSGSLPNF